MLRARNSIGKIGIKATAAVLPVYRPLCVRSLSSSSVPVCAARAAEGCRGILCSSLKNGVFLTVPEVRNSANATGTPHVATASAAFVRQVAKGGRIPDFRGSKKYLRFFQWSRKHPHPPGKREAGHDDPGGREVRPGRQVSP